MDYLDYIWQQICNTEVTLCGSIFKLTLSLVLGSLVGLERKRKGQIAGMRTFALISMGACLAMLVSIYIPQEYMGLKNGDPGRIAAQVVSGVGFLGAGAIIQMKGSVRGLTTAAGIWMTAMIGLSVGSGMYLVAMVATALIMFILVSVENYGHKIHIGWESKIVRVKVHGVVSGIDNYRQTFDNHNIHLSDEFLKYDYDQGYTVINFLILSKDKTDFVRLFEELHALNDTMSITLTNEMNL